MLLSSLLPGFLQGFLIISDNQTGESTKMAAVNMTKEVTNSVTCYKIKTYQEKRREQQFYDFQLAWLIIW